MATAGLVQMCCGHCGRDRFTIYKRSDGSLHVECSCGNASVVTTTEPKIEIAWADSSEGILTEKQQ